LYIKYVFKGLFASIEWMCTWTCFANYYFVQYFVVHCWIKF